MKKPVLFLSFLACLAFTAFLLPPSQNWRDKVAPELLAKAERGGTHPFIVKMAQQADLSDLRHIHGKERKAELAYKRLSLAANEGQASLRRFLQERRQPYRPFWVISALALKGDLQLIAEIAARPDVAFIYDDPQVVLEEPLMAAGSRSPEDLPWGLTMIGADQVWALGITGEGVVVGGQDTGVDWEHPAIQGKYRGWDGSEADHNYNWHDAIHEINPLHNDSIPNDPNNNPCGLNVPYPCDDHNHGTHTIGTMTGDDGGDNQIGVAPGAKWIACRNMERGYGTPSTYIECFEWFMAPTDINGENPDPAQAPHVINNSWGCPEMEGCNPSNFPLMQSVVDNVKASGIVVVVSAGNSGSSCSSVNAPAAIFPGSFTVGATASNDTIAGFSSRGPVAVDSSFRRKPDISAPGVGVYSCIRNGQYASWSGTSMAGPHVAGVVALMISANPELAGEVDVIQDIIEQTAVPKTTGQDCGDIPGSEVPNNTYGYGRINALAAVQQAMLYTAATEENASGSDELRVLPNPFSDELELQLPAFKGSAVFQLYNLQGQSVLETPIAASAERKMLLPVSHLPKGIYFYTLKTTNARIYTGKLIK